MKTVLELKNISKHFNINKGFKNFFSQQKEKFIAVDNVNLKLESKKVLGLVGESGSGKSTCGLMAMRLLNPSNGNIILENKDITTLKNHELKNYRKQMQIIFQDSYSSLNPMMTLAKIVIEPFVIHNLYTFNERQELANELLNKVGLDKTYHNRYPHELSGGERQRVSIARALALKPTILVADEPTSALDVCVKAQVINLLHELQEEMGLSILFISHELNVLRSLADTISVMYRGRIVEEGDTEIIFNNAKHPYTRSLLDAIPSLNPNSRKRRKFISAEEIETNIPKFSKDDVIVNILSHHKQLIQINDNHYVEGIIN
jgi:ABC-type oligopeptide transport system ATPase subunit